MLGSQLHLIPLEEDIKNINTVLQVEVTDVTREYNYMKLKNGKDGPMTSTSIIISGKIKEVIWGTYNLNEITTKHTWIIPIKYDEEGNKILGFSPIKSGSGFESNVEIGKEYIFCFRNTDETRSIQYHMRMDNISNKPNIIELLEKQKINF